MADEVVDDEAAGLLGARPAEGAPVDAVTAADPASAEPFIDQISAAPPATVPPGGVGGTGTLPGGVPDVAPPPAADAAPIVPPAPGAPAPAPPAPEVDPAALIERQRAVDVANAQAKLQADELARQQAAAHAKREQDIADQVARARTAAELKLEQASDYLNDHKELRDPRESWSAVDRIAAVVAMSFGALGAGLTSVATGKNEPNEAVAVINKRISDEIDRQKENYRHASDAYLRARTGVKDVDEARRILEEQENARDVAYHKDALAQAVELLDKQGVDEAGIAADQRIVELKKYLQAAKEKGIHTTLENEKLRAETEALRAKAARDLKKAKGGGAGGGAASIVALQDAVDAQKTNGEIARIGKAAGASDKQIEKAIADRGKAGGQGALPKVFTDSLTGRDLPIDPSRTDARKHNAAVAGIPQVNGAIQILDSVLADATKPRAPEALSMIGMDTSAQADLKGKMTRFRSAYAASKKESVGEANAHELAAAIPDPPSSFSTSASFANWRRKIESTRAELHDTRNALLANAGVPPAELDKREGKGGKAAPAPAAKADAGKRARAQAIVDDPDVPDAKKVGARAFLAASGG